MTTPSYNTTVKMGGTPVAFTNEPTTKTTANTVYQITDPTRRILDPNAAVVVEVDADGAGGGGYVAADPSTYTVDFMFGVITFASDQGASALVRVSANYIPTLAIAEAKEMSLNDAGSVLDKTAFGAAGWRSKMMGLQDFSGSLSTFAPLKTDNDPGAGTKKLRDLMRAGTPVLLEYRPGGAGDYFRGWAILENADEKAGVDALLEGTVQFQGTTLKGNNQTEHAISGWGT